MPWYDDYEPQEPSEVDGIVQEALNKLEEYFIDHSKLRIDSIIESAHKWEKKYKDCKDENRKFFSMITDRDTQIKDLQRELERKRTQLGILPFEPGEEVYYLSQSFSTTEKFTCPRCNGKGRVTIKHEGVEYTPVCPVCKDSNYATDHPNREASYSPWKLGCNKIESITQTVTLNNKTHEPEVDVNYRINGCNGYSQRLLRKKVAGGNLANESVIKELHDIADELNTKLRNECLIKVGREVPTDE